MCVDLISQEFPADFNDIVKAERYCNVILEANWNFAKTSHVVIDRTTQFNRSF